MKTTSGEWKGGIWHPAVKSGNPKGYNKHIKNPTPAAPVGNQLEEFEKLTEMQQKETIAKMGNQIYMLTREIRPLVIRFKKFKDYYDKKHFGWEWDG